MLTNLRLIAYGKAVGEGVTGARFATAEGVVKNNLENHPYVVANEYVAGEIGRFLGLPLPPGHVVMSDANEPLFLSMNFNPRGEDLPPAIPQFVAQLFPEEAAGTLVFDAFIGNSDRHLGNLALDLPTRQLAVFDHSHALFGYIPHQGTGRLDALCDTNHPGICDFPEEGGHGGNRHCLLDVLTQPLAITSWVEKVEQIPDYFLSRLSADTVKLGASAAEADSLRRYLTHRKTALRSILEARRTEFTQIQQWGLL